MSSQLNHLINKENGATALEYGLLAALIAVAIATAVITLGGQVNTIFSDIAAVISGVSAS